MYSAGYCAAKHGLIGLTRAMAVEFTKERLRVNAICPGGMPTAQATEFEAPENADWDLIMRIASPARVHGDRRRGQDDRVPGQ